jgi:transcriptional antiterminator NusG
VSVPHDHIASEQEEAVDALDPVAELRDDAVASSAAGASGTEDDLGDGTTGADGAGPGYLSEAGDDASPAADDAATGDEEDEELDAVARTRRELAELPGDWYVLHTYAGYENRVKANLEQRFASINM